MSFRLSFYIFLNVHKALFCRHYGHFAFKYKNKGKPCRSPNFTEDEIKDMFIRALNKLTKVKKAVTKEMNSLIGDICSATDFEKESSKLEREIEVIVSEMNSLIKANANTAQNQEEYLKRENQIRLKYQETRDRLTDINNKIELKQNKKTILLNFLKNLDGIDGEITEFDEDLWSGLLDYILIKDKGEYTAVFKNGTEIDI